MSYDFRNALFVFPLPLTSLFAILFSVCLLFVRGVFSLAAPALVLWLFAFPPAVPKDYLANAPVALLVLLLGLAALGDFCADLWRAGAARREEKRLLQTALAGVRPVAESLIRLERTARWRGLARTGEWLFLPLWLFAAFWINEHAATPFVSGAAAGVLLLLFFECFVRLDSERRERRIADGALRAAASLGLARAFGRLLAFQERSLVRHARARGAEQSLVLRSAVCLFLLRLTGAATLVLFLLYALTLFGDGRASVGELVAILFLLRSVFFWLEQRASALRFYARRERGGRLYLRLSSSAGQDGERASASPSAPPSASSSVAGETKSATSILQAEQGEIVPDSQALLSLEGLVLQQGEAVVVAGESGCGKSLLLKACAGLVGSEGLRLSGEAVSLGALSSQRIGYVPQQVALLDGSLGENIAAFGAACDQARATELLLRLGAESVLARLPEGLATRTDPFDVRLPHSFKVQVLLAAALYARPKLLLCDACIDTLDSKGIESFARLLQDFCKKGAALVVTRQSALLQVCRRAWICAHNKVQVRELEVHRG